MSELLERTLHGLRQALAVSPDNGPLWLQVADILAELGRKNEALEACREALRLLADEEGRARAEELRERLQPRVARTAVPDDAPSESGNVFQLVRGGRQKETAEPLTVLDRERTTFADVGGLDDVKDTIRLKIVLPFERPEIFQAYKKKQGGGILLYGPPGCGKTLLARATAGECQAAFMNVAIDDVLDMWYGESERKLAGLFERARKHAPTILFFDELEAIGGSRQQLRHSAGQSLVNQLLAEMDGVTGSNARVLVMAATNAPWHVDAALRRPGRFDRVIFVPPPDRTARTEILRLHMRERPAEAAVNVAELAKKTDEFSGADLLDLVERATERPLKDALRTGEVRPITHADLQAALAAAKPTTREWFATAKNYATFANTGGLYDDLLSYLSSRK
jgi:transitional endoplasmic reticulum ATPase